jgi:hypothetical protein
MNPKISPELKNQILQDPLLENNWKIKQKARQLVSKIEEYENYFADDSNKGKKPPKFLTDEVLNSIKEHEEGSDWEKIIKALCNNGLEPVLFELIDYEEKVRKIQPSAFQSIVGVGGGVKIKGGFSPFATSSASEKRENLSAENIMSIAQIKESVDIEGGFSPQWGEKINTKQEKTQKVAKKDLISQINQLSNKINLTSEELAFINKIKELIQKKNNFLRARQETIQELRECCDILESNLIKGKYAQNNERTNLLTIAGKVAGNWTFNLIEATWASS